MAKSDGFKRPLFRAVATGVIACMMTTPAFGARADCPSPAAHSYPPKAPGNVSLDDASSPSPCYPGEVQTGVRVSARPSFISLTLRPGGAEDGTTGMYQGEFDECHLYVEPAANAPAGNAKKLFLFIEGTGALPTSYQHILLHASNAGFYGVTIHYPNKEEVGRYCEPGSQDDKGNLSPGSNIASCTSLMRREIIEGRGAGGDADISNGATVDLRNSIHQRLLDFIRYMKWTQFLAIDPTTKQLDVDWTSIIVAGHSQGAGHALFVARLHPVYRAVALSGAEDRDASTTGTDPNYPDALRQPNVAPWLIADGSWATPPGSLFALIHEGDGVQDMNGVDHGENAPRNITGHAANKSACLDFDDNTDKITDPYYIDTCRSAYQGWIAAGIWSRNQGSKPHYQTIFDPPASTTACSPDLHNSVAADYAATPDAQKFWDDVIFASVPSADPST